MYTGSSLLHLDFSSAIYKGLVHGGGMLTQTPGHSIALRSNVRKQEVGMYATLMMASVWRMRMMTCDSSFVSDEQLHGHFLD